MARFTLSKMKVVLISTGVVSIAVAAKLSAPVVTHFCVYQVPVLWSYLVSLLRPPYLYLLINCIIISIVASTRFHKEHDEEDWQHVGYHQSQHGGVPSSYDEGKRPETVGGDAFYVGKAVDRNEKKDVDGTGGRESHNGSGRESVPVDTEEEFVISRSTWVPPPRVVGSAVESLPEPVVSYSPAAEKPLVSSRFAHRKSFRSSPEGARALRVSKPKRHETLENTWKTITEGRHMPLARHQKKPETALENDGQFTIHEDGCSDRSNPSGIDLSAKKAKTFRDRTNQQDSPSPPSSSGRLRKEPSLSQDELNRRVEAFIKKFNDQIRMQRQESLDNYYQEMINRPTNAQ